MKPKRTFLAANALAKSLSAGDTLAFCKGGSFTSGGGYLSNWTSTACTSTNPCTIREYTPPTFPGTKMPIINHPRMENQQPPRGPYDPTTTYAKNDLITDSSGTITYVSLQNSNTNHEPPTQANGYKNTEWWKNWRGELFYLRRAPNANLQILNFRIQGDGTGNAFFFSEGTTDVTVCNLEIDSLSSAFYNESAGSVPNQRISVRGNKITSSRAMGYLGAANDSEIAYNYWEFNGTTNTFDHTLYISAHKPVSNFQVVGNIIKGQYGPQCLGVPFVTHGAISNYRVEGNSIDIDAAAVQGGCWGMAFDVGGNQEAAYVRNGLIARNTIRNGGNLGVALSNCNRCIIENNIVAMDWCNGPNCGWSIDGMIVPKIKARAGLDDASADVTIRNNTFWFGPNAQGGALGLGINAEGPGYVVANNLVFYSSTNPGQGVNCFDFSAGLSAFKYIDYNACYSAAPLKWEKTRGSLDAWKEYAKTGSVPFDANSFSLEGESPLVKPDDGFAPKANSRLIGAGDSRNAPTTDIYGNPRHVPPDIGAVEHVGD